ncbi:MAG: hypothetical protein L7U60_03075 [Bacteroidia bacterium]|jgi:uncharacterized protein YggE|nr:hypothetical protein [Bacteroidia bacterium]
MKKALKLSLGLLFTLVVNQAVSQVSGNATWNQNNRFKQNSTYERQLVPPANLSVMGLKGKRSDNRGRNISTTQQWSFGDNGSQPIVGTEKNTLIQIRVLKNATPTSYTAIFHINQAGKEVAELDSQLVRRVRKFISLGKEIGIEPSNFYTDMIALVPIFRKEKKFFSSTYIEVPKGFEMQKNIHVRYSKPSQLDRLFTIAAQCEIYDLIKVEYHYDATESAQEEIRTKARSILKKRLEHLKSINENLDTCYRRVSEIFSQIDPVDQYVSYNPLAVSAITEESSETNSRPHRTTLFHNQLGNDKFDAVINPSPLEPSIQMVYTMNVMFDREHPIQRKIEQKVRTKMMMVTPQGQITERWLD